MSQENVETVLRAMAVLNEDGIGSEAGLAFLHEGFVFEEPPEQPAPRVARGRDAAVEMLKQFNEAWEAHRSELQEARALDPERVLVLSVEHFRGP